MATNCKQRIKTKRRTITVAEQTCCGVAKTTGGTALSVLDGGTIQASDDNIAIEATGGNLGVVENIGTAAKYEVSYPLRMAGSGSASEPEISLFLKGSTHKRVVTTVLDINTIAGAGFELGETLTNTTQANDVGIIGNIVDMVYIKGDLTVNGVFLTGVSTISVANSDIGKLNINDSFKIAGDATTYVVSAVTEWVDCSGSNQDVTFAPTLAQDTVGAEIITVTGKSKVFLYTLDNAPVATDALLGGTSATTALVQAIDNDHAQLYYPVSDSTELSYLTIIDNIDNKERITHDCIGNTVMDFVGGDYPKLTFTSQGLYNAVSDNTLVSATTCSASTKPFQDAMFVFNGRDMRDLSFTEFHLESGIEIQTEMSALSDNGIKGFFLSNTLPTLNFKISQTTVADFDPDTFRDNRNIIPLTLIHNVNGVIDEKICISVPSSQLNAYASNEDTNGQQSHTVNSSCNISCDTGLPKYSIYIY